MNRETRFIEHWEVEAYREAGWRIQSLPGNHGFYRALAVREIEEEETCASSD